MTSTKKETTDPYQTPCTFKLTWIFFFSDEKDRKLTLFVKFFSVENMYYIIISFSLSELYDTQSFKKGR